MEYLLHILIIIMVYIILSLSLNLLAGYTGILSIAHSACFGIGAYTTALLMLHIKMPFVYCIMISIILTALSGLLIGIPSLRIHGDYFVIATFAFQIIIFSVLNNWVSLTGGPMGIAGIPQPIIAGWKVDTNLEFLILTSFFAVMAFWVCKRIVEAPFGRVLKAIREDEVFSTAAGKNIFKYKILIFIISAGIASISGALYVVYARFCDPTSFTVMESIFIISIVIIGGAGSLWGPVVGSVVLVSLPELLRFIGLPSSVAANLRQILYGSLLVVFMIWRPRGLVGKYSFYKK